MSPLNSLSREERKDLLHVHATVLTATSRRQASASIVAGLPMPLSTSRDGVANAEQYLAASSSCEQEKSQYHNTIVKIVLHSPYETFLQTCAPLVRLQQVPLKPPLQHRSHCHRARNTPHEAAQSCHTHLDQSTRNPGKREECSWSTFREEYHAGPQQQACEEVSVC